MIFSAVRAMNGRNNNPTFTQFKAAYRRLLNIQDSSIVAGNCTAQDDTVILCTADVMPLGQTTQQALGRKYDFTHTMNDIPDHDYCIYSQLTGVLSHISNLALFQNLKDHMFDTEVTDNHIHTLCKSIVSTYIQVRFHHEAKTFTSTIRGTNARNQLTKVILFKNQ